MKGDLHNKIEKLSDADSIAIFNTLKNKMIINCPGCGGKVPIDGVGGQDQYTWVGKCKECKIRWILDCEVWAAVQNDEEVDMFRQL